MGGDSDSPTIRAINKRVVHRICSGQVILDLSSAIKELVENSLDAGASSIEISLKEHGAESFKVTDNGCGISPDNFQVLALKHHTSKLADFYDLQSLTTFGFRGEALSSLSALGNLIVETRTKNESVGTRLTFDHTGMLKSETRTARQVGTTVTIEKLFSTLPVRSKEFGRNIRREYGKFISLLNAYALIAKGVRFVCTNITAKNSKSVVLKTQGSSSLKDNIINLFGLSTFTCLNPLNLSVSENCKMEGFLSKPGNGNGRNLGDRQFFYINGRPVDMPKVGKLVNELYRCSNSKQQPIVIMNFVVSTKSYDVNVTPDKRKIFLSDEGSLMLSLREAIEKIYSPNQCSYLVNKIEDSECESDETESDASLGDNESPVLTKPVPPSKGCALTDADSSQQYMDSSPRETMHQVANVVKEMAHKKAETFVSGDFTPTVCKISKSRISSSYQDEQDDDVSVLHEKFSPQASYSGSQTKKEKMENSNASSQSNFVQSSITKFITVNKRKHENNCSVLSEMPILRSEMGSCQVRKVTPGIRALIPRYHVLGGETSEDDTNESLEHSSEIPRSNLVESHGIDGYDKISTAEGSENQDKNFPLSDVYLKASACEDLENPSRTPQMKMSLETADTSPIRSCSGTLTSPILQFDINYLRQRRLQRTSRSQSTVSTNKSMKIGRCYAAATLENSQAEHEGKEKSLAAATIELERFFRKQDFGQMKVVGQFNLGFIIAKLDKDLFIVDQHAADEKYNYEQLSQSTILKQQPFLRPLWLELSPEEEVICSVHMEIIRKNGFCLIEDIHAAPGHRFLLKSVPFSKNITFGVEDVKELIAALADGQEECSIMSSYKLDTADSLCPPRVRAMLASRACHSSVTIGDPLAHNEMKKILQNLTRLKSPWNCPHGRPTMRHLVDLSAVHNKIRKY